MTDAKCLECEELKALRFKCGWMANEIAERRGMRVYPKPAWEEMDELCERVRKLENGMWAIEEEAVAMESIS